MIKDHWIFYFNNNQLFETVTRELDLKYLQPNTYICHKESPAHPQIGVSEGFISTSLKSEAYVCIKNIHDYRNRQIK